MNYTCVEDAALLKTHPHTSERRGYEADKERQAKRERDEGLSETEKERQ